MDFNQFCIKKCFIRLNTSFGIEVLKEANEGFSKVQSVSSQAQLLQPSHLHAINLRSICSHRRLILFDALECFSLVGIGRFYEDCSYSEIFNGKGIVFPGWGASQVVSTYPTNSKF